MIFGIATARIHGLKTRPYKLAEAYYAWDITFSGDSTLFFSNLKCINLGKTLPEAIKLQHKFKQHFKNASIENGDRVAVIFSRDGKIRAIGSIGHDCWIDVTDNFIKKTFKALNLDITSLKVH